MQDVNLLDLISQTVNPLLILIAAVLVIFVPIAWARAKRWLEAQYQQLPQNLREALESAAILAARFVEQLDLTDQLEQGIEDFAKYRMNMALDQAFALLIAQGIKIEPKTEEYVRTALRGLIENVILAGLHKKEVAEAEARAALQLVRDDEAEAPPLAA